MIDKDDRTRQDQLLGIGYRIALALESIAEHRRDVRDDLGAIIQTLNGIEQLLARGAKKNCRWECAIIGNKQPRHEFWKCLECGDEVGPVAHEEAHMEVEHLKEECTG